MNNINENEMRHIINEGAVFIILIVCVVIRLFTYKDVNCTWIWIVNYIGMAVAVLNLLINKTISLYNDNSDSFKTFFGFTLFTLLILCLICLWVGMMQKSDFCTVVNDIITLLALFFSLSQRIWNSFLNKINECIS